MLKNETRGECMKEAFTMYCSRVGFTHSWHIKSKSKLYTRHSPLEFKQLLNQSKKYGVSIFPYMIL